MQINPVKGTHDIYNEESKEYSLLINQASNIAERFNYVKMTTPILESTNLFVRSVGESSDIVNKEMYTFLDKGGRSLTLRPEVTAGIMRSIATNKLYANAELPLKYYYVGPCFRYERPQAGRYRQFHQFGIEAVGNPSAQLDAETISLGYLYLKSLKFSNVKVVINSLGDEETRINYRNALKQYFSQYIENMCEDCKRRFETNPLRILDCKVPEDNEIAKNAPKLSDFLSDNAREYFDKVLNLLKLFGVDNVIIDNSLVRGLDYYTGVVWEYHISSNDATDVGAIGGGGHYKNLLKEIGGPDLEGVGLAIGLERAHYLWSTLVKKEPVDNKLDFYIAPMGDNALEVGIKFATSLREKGYSVSIPYENKSLKSLLKSASKSNAKFAIIIGDEEINNDNYIIKDLSNGVQTNIKFNDIVGEQLNLNNEIIEKLNNK